MSQILKAIYRDGAFIPQTPCDLPEGAEVEITVRASNLISPKVTDPEERKRLMDELIRSMLDNPLPENASRLTREELHERR
jgi:predicted DNA-binding antitoxin AbrB/MazE fold protein